MSRWYRAYSGIVKDDKLAEVAVIAGCSRSVAIATWHAILESAADSQDGGRFDTTPRRVAAVLGEPASVIETVFAAMAELGMVGDGAVTAWKRRQFESDSSTERSRKHRETKRNGDATLQQQDATPPDTDTETDTEEEKKEDTRLRALLSPEGEEGEGKRGSAYPAAFELLWDCFPRSNNSSKLKAFKAWKALPQRQKDLCLEGVGPLIDEVELKRRSWPEFQACHLVTYINQRRWEALLEGAA